MVEVVGCANDCGPKELLALAALSPVVACPNIGSKSRA